MFRPEGKSKTCRLYLPGAGAIHDQEGGSYSVGFAEHKWDKFPCSEEGRCYWRWPHYLVQVDNWVAPQVLVHPPTFWKAATILILPPWQCWLPLLYIFFSCDYSVLFHLQEFGCPCHHLWKYLQLDALTNQSGFPLPLSCQALFGKFMFPCWFVNPLNLHLWNLLFLFTQCARCSKVIFCNLLVCFLMMVFHCVSHDYTNLRLFAWKGLLCNHELLASTSADNIPPARNLNKFSACGFGTFSLSWIWYNRDQKIYVLLCNGDQTITSE